MQLIYLRAVTLRHSLFSRSKDVFDVFITKKFSLFYFKLPQVLYFRFDTSGIFVLLLDQWTKFQLVATLQDRRGKQNSTYPLSIFRNKNRNLIFCKLFIKRLFYLAVAVWCQIQVNVLFQCSMNSLAGTLVQKHTSTWRFTTLVIRLLAVRKWPLCKTKTQLYSYIPCNTTHLIPNCFDFRNSTIYCLTTGSANKNEFKGEWRLKSHRSLQTLTK